jgi:RNA-directed DNA polymerase
MDSINSWNEIQWRDIESKVFRLQLRIFRAAANKESEKLHKLQKLLINSKFAKYLAVRRVTQDKTGKRTPGIDKRLIKSSKERFDLSNQLTLDGKSSPIRRIENRAKQMLAYLALCPEWEAQFEASSYGFRPGRSVTDAIEALFLGIAKKPKWVLDADISKCFDEINHNYLLDKCNTFPKMRKQLKAWLKAGILEGEKFTFPEMGGIISPLLINIALHGLREHIDNYINSLGGHCPKNQQALTYVRYADDLVLMYPEKEILEGAVKVVQQFLKPIGLELHPTKTRIIHTREPYEEHPAGFTYLGFDIVQKQKRNRQRMVKAFNHVKTDQLFITLITPSKEGVKKHKAKIRETIHKYKGASQERLIQVMNPIIRGWANSKRSQASSKTFQALDTYVWFHLWKWARKRHPKMPKMKLKQKYWHIIGKNKWIFGVKKKDETVVRIQLHSKIPIKRHAKVKGTASPFDGNLIYWAKRTGKNFLIPNYKARLIQE